MGGHVFLAGVFELSLSNSLTYKKFFDLEMKSLGPRSDFVMFPDFSLVTITINSELVKSIS